MRVINTSEIINQIRDMCMQVNVQLSDDVKTAILSGKEKEESPLGCQILGQLEENMNIAAEMNIPICQDTGMTVVFLKVGQDVHFEGNFIEDAVN